MLRATGVRTGSAATLSDAELPEDEQLIDIIDVWQLHHYQWPFIWLFARRAIDELERDRYMAALLSTGRWDRVRTVPHRDEHGVSSHVFDVYAHPASLR